MATQIIVLSLKNLILLTGSPRPCYAGLGKTLGLFLICISAWAPLLSMNLDKVSEAQKPFLIWGTGPLFGVALNIFPKDLIIASTFPLYTKATKKTSSCLLSNTLYYAITDRLSIFLNVPVILKEQKLPHQKSRGLANLILQGEYAFIQRNDADGRFQCTVAANVTMPTTTAPINTSTSNTKAPSYFLGLTTCNESHFWYTYGDISTYITTTRHHFKLGERLYYDLGIGHVFFRNDKMVFAGFIEMSGNYARPNTVNKQRVLTTGGNRLFLGPTARLLYQSLLLIAGYQQVISDTSRESSKTKYRAGATVAYYF